jgi:hypothetical protein
MGGKNFESWYLGFGSDETLLTLRFFLDCLFLLNLGLIEAGANWFLFCMLCLWLRIVSSFRSVNWDVF